MLAKIADPDANVFLQRGVLAFADKDWPAAGAEFARAWEKDPSSYPAAYNLMLTRLCQGQLDGAVEMLDKLLELAPSPAESRFLSIFRSLVGRGDAGADQTYQLGTISADEERRLLDMIVGLSQFDVVYRLLAKLVTARPSSEAAFRAYIGAALVQAKMLVDRCQWSDAELLLSPLRRRLESTQIK